MARFFKVPLVFYRLGLGKLIGPRLMRLTHKGRRSGKVYRSVLVALHVDQQTHAIYAVSPWTTRNWYKNIQAAPALEVECGAIRYAPAQRPLSPEEIAGAFVEFRQKYPIFSRMVARIPSWNINSTHEEFVELARTLRGVAFIPR